MGLRSHKKRMKTLTVDNKIIAPRITTVELQQNFMHASIMYIVIQVANIQISKLFAFVHNATVYDYLI